MRRELTIATDTVEPDADMKDDAKHKKRHKSESDSAKTADAAHKSSGGHAPAADSSHNKPNRKVSHVQPPPQQHATAAEARSRRISRHKMDHDDHGHHARKISRDHGYHDDPHHTSASSHPIRPRRDTMMSRGHSHHGQSDRRSDGTGEEKGPVVFYENTYKLTPDCRFKEGPVKKVIRDVLKENITEQWYDPNVCGAKCKLLSEIIKERVKHLDLARFKIISMVMIGQVFDQSMLVTSRCLWDHRFDNAVSVEYKKGDILAVGLVFAVYHE